MKRLIVFTREYFLMAQMRKMPEKILDGKIIKLFDKTPEPVEATDVVCPHFVELKWGWGCPYDCSFCFLKGTFRFYQEDGRVKPHFKPKTRIKADVELFLSMDLEPTLLNAGELCDALMGESLSEPFSEFILPMLKGTRHRILFLTKGTNIKRFIEHPEWRRNAVLSWSLNASPVAERWEKLAPTVEDRIRAAGEVFDAGYEVRLRIDPMIPVEGWSEHYRRLVDEVFSQLFPERITLGSLRGLVSTRNSVKDKSWLQFLCEKSSWGLKTSHATRLEMYGGLINYLREKYSYVNVGLCKETLRIWGELGLDWRRNRCNCLL